jgi:hypothetical protein
MVGRVEGVDCEDRYFCTSEIPADEVEAAIRFGHGVAA